MHKLGISLSIVLGFVSTLSADPKVHSKSHPINKVNCSPLDGRYLNDECGALVFITGDYILFAMREDGLQTLLGGYNWSYDPNAAPFQNLQQMGIIYPKMRLCSGFKVGLGFVFEDDGWDTCLRYTWLNCRTSSMRPTYTYATDEDEGPLVVPAWRFNYEAFGLLDDLNNGVISTRSKWDVQWNRFDWTLARTFSLDHRFFLRQFLGLVGWWEYQRLFIDYEAFIRDGLPPSPGEVFAEVRAYQNAGGVGPYLGGELEFLLYGDECSCFSLFMQNGIAMVWSYYEAKWTVQKDFASAADPLPGPTDVILPVVNAKNVFWTTSPMLELLWGLRYTSMSTDDAVGFAVQVGWELQAWFDHFHAYNTFYLTGSGTSNALFTMQGLDIRLTLIF